MLVDTNGGYKHVNKTQGPSVSFGILYREMRLEFGTSHTEAAWIASIFNGLLGFVGIPLSLVANKIGERWPTVCGSLLLALGMLTSMFAKKTSIMYVTYGLLAGSGAGIIDFCANTHLVANFNDKWRPVAATVTNAGVPLSALILPPILTTVIEQFDLKKALLFLACLSLLGVPAGLCFYPQKLTDISQSESITEQRQHTSRKLSRFLKNANYMLYLTSACIIGFVFYVPATFLPDLMHECDRSSREVYICLMTMGSGDLTARLLLGFLVQWKPTYVAFIHSAGIIVLCASSVLITFSKSFEAFIIMSGMIGIGSGCFAGLFFFLSTHVLPAEDVRFGYGIVLTFVGMALVVGMPLAGFVTDFFGTVRGAFIFSSIVFFISVLLELIIGIRDVCLKKSSTIKVIQPEVNTVFNTDEDL